MPDNIINSADDDTTIAADQASSMARNRVHGSIRLCVTVTAASRLGAIQAAPGAVRDAFAAMPGAVIPTAGLAVGFPQRLPGADIQPRRYQVPVTVHGHIQLADSDVNLPDAALNAIAEFLDGYDDVTADLSSAVCDHVDETDVDETDVDETDVDETDVGATDVGATDATV